MYSQKNYQFNCFATLKSAIQNIKSKPVEQICGLTFEYCVMQY